MTGDTSPTFILTPEERYIAHLERMSGGMLTWRAVPTAPPRYVVYWRRHTTIFHATAPTVFEALAHVVAMLVRAGHLAPQDR